ncbi:peptidase S1 and S6 [Streptomyces sp. NPDC000594]|uniref:aggregation-promoting factor C-terminal-like domain-containing protein n=1 Tax=Streptomyces sp. NPDC000594 TaxID=3154261 RepID=UPI003331FC05
MPAVRHALRASTGALLSGAVGAGLLTAATFAAAPAASAAPTSTTCTGTASVYGVLDDGRITFSAINPARGDLTRVRVGPDLGFTPKAMATLNFNTVLVTSTAGALYRVDVRTNNTTLELAGVEKIAASGWTHDKLTYDGHGHLYGTAGGTLIQYLVSQDKPQGSQHIGQRKEIGSGFVLKTLTAAGDDRLLATTAAGALHSYKINSNGSWDRDDLKADGWSGFDQLVSPGGGLYYGRMGTTGALYWYKDANPQDGSGADITYHNDDPVNTDGWSQKLLSAQPNTFKCTTTTTPETVDRDNIAQVKAAGRNLMAARGASWNTDTQWSCLERLWERESGWRWNADNPSSAAYGIPQANPGSKMGLFGADWKTNPITQIKWGLYYIENRYDTPCGAWNHFLNNNWY